MWKKEIYKGKELLGAPGAPCSPPGEGASLLNTRGQTCSCPGLTSALVQDTAPPWCLLFQTSRRCCWQQTKTKGAEQPPWPALALGQGSHRPPKLAQGMVPTAGAGPSAGPRERLGQPPNFSSVREMKKEMFRDWFCSGFGAAAQGFCLPEDEGGHGQAAGSVHGFINFGEGFPDSWWEEAKEKSVPRA